VTSMTDNSGALREQRSYYQARASEYDEWWLRRGRYDRGAELNEQWFSETAAVANAVDEFRPAGRILELACGTGFWSERLLPYASELVLLDGSSEMLGLASGRLQSPKVRCIDEDIFSWHSTERFDTIFFGFWLSHVPPDRFEEFWKLVRQSLAAEGRVFFVDSLYEESSTAADQRLPGSETTTLKRRLNDGREFRIYKVFYEQGRLRDRLLELGWRFRLSRTNRHFLYGDGAHV
ncbi:MAG: class I SAM-dependent methyltransferase, partial [Terriglobia bacterium]